jgi:hypothetical protein
MPSEHYVTRGQDLLMIRMQRKYNATLSSSVTEKEFFH